jgi:predicted RNA-binding protein Jag
MTDDKPESVPEPSGEDLTAPETPILYDEEDPDAQIRDLGRADAENIDAGDESLDGDLRTSVDGANSGVEILTRLLDLMGLEGDVVLERIGPSVTLNIEGDDLGVLIGRRGLTLSSLQFMVRLMIASRQAEWPAISVDVCGYKQRRHAALQDLAKKLADQAKYRRRPVTLEPMPADERRVVHLALANHPDVYTESVGEDVERKVVIHPKRT